MSFECHITLHNRHAEVGKQVAELFGWKTSAIDGDPLLGKEVYFYLTKHDESYEQIAKDMYKCFGRLCELQVETVRLKIEEILFDSRSLRGNHFPLSWEERQLAISSGRVARTSPV